jgi:hypothetical protein
MPSGADEFNLPVTWYKARLLLQFVRDWNSFLFRSEPCFMKHISRSHLEQRTFNSKLRPGCLSFHFVRNYILHFRNGNNLCFIISEVYMGVECRLEDRGTFSSNYLRLRSKCLLVIGNHTRPTPTSHLHNSLNIQPIPVLIHRLTINFLLTAPYTPTPQSNKYKIIL